LQTVSLPLSYDRGVGVKNWEVNFRSTPISRPKFMEWKIFVHYRKLLPHKQNF